MSEATATIEKSGPAQSGVSVERPPLVENKRETGWISNYVSSIVEEKTPIWWWIAITITSSMALICFSLLGYLIATGVGVWGNNHPVGWAWDITNFVFWIGIGHAGTLISAILFLTRQKWRTSINRAAEAMTLFAVVCAGLYPALHVGRVWMVWFLAPVPNANAIWQNFRSPLLWDVFAVSTYFTVSVLFWYTGLIPDLATLRDRAKTKIRKFAYGILALGWRGGNRQWKHYEMAYMLLAGLSTPLVLSVHSVVSFDFATSVIPGWHTTIFPPYFVAGAIFGGFAMVLTILIPAKAIYKPLGDMVTGPHIDKMCKIILMTGSIVGYAYLMELFIAWYGANPYERAAFWYRVTGEGAMWYYIPMMFCNVVAPQVFWFKWARTNLLFVWIAVQFPNAGMWYERFVIIGTTLQHDFMPSVWRVFDATWVDVWTFVGTFGLFTTLFLLFMRFLPMICMFEVKAVLPESDPHHGGNHK
ncbi:MAG: NrfD/PsrC family molybdoenzyme membrane anchor subunit [Chthoniobacterales bacterium]